jgi:hypothetical protein
LDPVKRKRAILKEMPDYQEHHAATHPNPALSNSLLGMKDLKVSDTRTADVIIRNTDAACVHTVVGNLNLWRSCRVMD